METKNGEVKAISKRVVNVKGKDKNAYSLKIGEGNNWYSGFDAPPCMKGDIITIDYEVNGDYNNIKKVVSVVKNANNIDNSKQKPTESKPTETKPTESRPIQPKSTNDLIMKQVALKCSIELAKVDGCSDLGDIKSNAEDLYKWLRG